MSNEIGRVYTLEYLDARLDGTFRLADYNDEGWSISNCRQEGSAAMDGQTVTLVRRVYAVEEQKPVRIFGDQVHVMDMFWFATSDSDAPNVPPGLHIFYAVPMANRPRGWLFLVFKRNFVQ
jgi:hypothetical protein